MSTASPAETTVLYREKLWPSPATWIWPLLISATAGVAFAPIAMGLGIAVGVATLVVICLIMVLNVGQIVITEDSVRVARAHIEREFIGEVTGYRGEEAFKQRGQKLHGLAFMNLRGGFDAVVKLEVTDPRDQTPYWLTATRRPEELTRVLGGLMDEYRRDAEEADAADNAGAADPSETGPEEKN